MPGRVILLRAEDPGPWPSGRFEAALDRLPHRMQGEIAQFHRWMDRQARILGRLLLRAGLVGLGLQRFADFSGWSRDAWGRPRLEGCPADFSISHTAGLALCAVSLDGRVGADVESNAPLNPDDLRLAFGAAEWAALSAAADPPLAALRLWTAKEAALKADGRGFSLEASTIDARHADIWIGGTRWAISRPALGPRWVCGVATSWPAPDIDILEPDFAALGATAELPADARGGRRGGA